MSKLAAVLQTSPGLNIERRDSRDAVSVAIPFRLRDGETVLHGLRLSLRQVVVAEEATGSVATIARDVTLHVPLDGFELTLPMRLAARQPIEAGLCRYEIAEIDPATEATLAQLVRIVLTGWLPSAEDLAKGWDEETPLRTAAAARPKLRSWLFLLAAVVPLILGIGFAARHTYLSWTTVVAKAAAITAPRTDIVSPDYGSVAPGGALTGAVLQSGDGLITVVSEAISAEIEDARANLDRLDALITRSASTTPNPGVTTERDLAANHLSALERRVAALQFRTPCTCAVLWAAMPGVPVAPGALLASLAGTGDDAIRAEALISPKAALGVVPGQEAQVTLPGSTSPRMAKVETLRYDFLPIPQVGLGQAEGNLVTVVLKFDEPTEGLVPGTPVDVVIFR